MTTNMADCQEAIDEQIKAAGIRGNVEVQELYLAKRNLKAAPDLTKYNKLLFLWLNGNKLRSLAGISRNMCLRELRLQNNMLVELTGAFAHVPCLELLLLHNNQLQQLERVVQELRRMLHLKVLTLHNNPVAQEKDYRLYTVYHIPSVKLLDFREVQKLEHIKAAQLINQMAESVKLMIGFGSRSAGHLAVHLAGDCNDKCVPIYFSAAAARGATCKVGEHHLTQVRYKTSEEAIRARALRRSVMEFSRFDWSKVPRGEERRVLKVAFETPQLITTRFR